MEDKEIGEGEEHAVAETRERRKRNKRLPHEEVLADFGLTMADFERKGGTRLDPNARAIGLRFLASGIAKTLIGELAGLVLIAYSYRRASMGSRRLAFSAGRRPATKPMISSTRVLVTTAN